MTKIQRNRAIKQDFAGVFKYLPAFVFGIIGLYTIEYQQSNPYYLLITSFGIIPFLELFLKPVKTNSSPPSYFFYDVLLYLIVAFHYYLLYRYLDHFAHSGWQGWYSVGLISALGILCGVYGINVAHEMGHRKRRSDQWAAQALLLTSLYMHFFIEHNRGHHKRVGTPADPATARKNESLYSFWGRVVTQSYSSAFQLEAQRLRNGGKAVWSFQNQFLRFQLIQVAFGCFIFILFGAVALASWLASALIGILLLETINYVEHYGLMRNEIAPGVYEKVQHQHSWNSDHPLGRYLLFELTRHSDHHENSLRKYPALRSHGDAPELPFGYPAMMLLSLVPPLWKRIMNPRLEAFNAPSGSSSVETE